MGLRNHFRLEALVDKVCVQRERGTIEARNPLAWGIKVEWGDDGEASVLTVIEVHVDADRHLDSIGEGLRRCHWGEAPPVQIELTGHFSSTERDLSLELDLLGWFDRGRLGNLGTLGAGVGH